MTKIISYFFTFYSKVDRRSKNSDFKGGTNRWDRTSVTVHRVYRVVSYSTIARHQVHSYNFPSLSPHQLTFGSF